MAAARRSGRWNAPEAAGGEAAGAAGAGVEAGGGSDTARGDAAEAVGAGAGAGAGEAAGTANTAEVRAALAASSAACSAAAAVRTGVLPDLRAETEEGAGAGDAVGTVIDRLGQPVGWSPADRAGGDALTAGAAGAAGGEGARGEEAPAAAVDVAATDGPRMGNNVHSEEGDARLGFIPVGGQFMDVRPRIFLNRVEAIDRHPRAQFQHLPPLLS